MNRLLPKHTIVLLGIGHTNAHIVRKWRMAPLPDTRLVCVSNFPVSTYSGMLPGVLAGNYRPQQMQIDLVRLCAAAGAELILADVVGLDPSAKLLSFESRPPLRFDALSIGIGSVPRIDAEISADAPVVAIKPMQTFLDRLTAQTRSAISTPAAGSSRGAAMHAQSGRPITIAVVGGGAAGVEISLCLPGFLRRFGESTGESRLPDAHVLLIQGEQQLLPGVGDGLRRRVDRELIARGVEIRCGDRVTQVQGQQILFDDESECSADIILWATGAAAPPLLGRLDLPLDSNGFLLTDQTLKTTAACPVFAVGDSGTIQQDRVPKAGVYAVRQGPVLWENLGRILNEQPLRPYRPQRRFLKLLNRGDGTAFGEYHRISFGGAWTWRLKDWIDRRFMEKYQGLTPMEMGSEDDAPMRCHGCGSKLSSSSLFDVLETIGLQERDGHTRGASCTVPVGIHEADDAAVIRIGDARPIVLSTDFFPAPLDDACLSGRIAALHAMNDIFAMGAQPTAAMALVTLPHGPPHAQQEVLRELMHGCQHEFALTGTSLVGGHTTEGSETTIGFSVIGEPWGEQLCRKGAFQESGMDHGANPDAPRVQPDDRLILTKPLGSGVLLAALRRSLCEADWYTSLVEMMLTSVGGDARYAWELGARWMTDVSGFGLAGHLVELLRGQSASAEIDLAAIPVLAGSVEVSSSGIASFLFAANRSAASPQMDIPTDLVDDSRVPLLFDPQTCGGLLIVLSKPQADSFLRQKGGTAADIGRIVPSPSSARVQVIASSHTEQTRLAESQSDVAQLR